MGAPESGRTRAGLPFTRGRMRKQLLGPFCFSAALLTLALAALLQAQWPNLAGGNPLPDLHVGNTLADHDRKGGEWLQRAWSPDLFNAACRHVGLECMARTPWYSGGSTIPFEYSKVSAPPPWFNGFEFSYSIPVDDVATVTFTLRRVKDPVTGAYRLTQHDWQCVCTEPGQLYPFRVRWLAGPLAGKWADTDHFSLACKMARSGGK